MGNTQGVDGRLSASALAQYLRTEHCGLESRLSWSAGNGLVGRFMQLKLQHCFRARTESFSTSGCNEIPAQNKESIPIRNQLRLRQPSANGASILLGTVLRKYMRNDNGSRDTLGTAANHPRHLPPCRGFGGGFGTVTH